MESADPRHGLYTLGGGVGTSLLAARLLESQAAERLPGGAAKAGAMLTALADGADATQTSSAIGRVNTESHLAATRLRFELMGYLGGELANAVLRVATRGGRLLGKELRRRPDC